MCATACSSSLVALHDAVTDLEAGRCEYAVVGGSSAIVIPHVTMGFHKLQASLITSTAVHQLQRLPYSAVVSGCGQGRLDRCAHAPACSSSVALHKCEGV